MRLATLSLLFGFAFCSLFWVAPLTAQDEPEAPLAKDVKIDILGSNIVVQGKAFTIPFDLFELTELLGPGNRVSKLHNWITTWDDLGVIAYCKPETTKVISVAVCIAKKDYKFSPKKSFAGKVSLDGAEITPQSRLAGINAAKKGVKLRSNRGLEEDEKIAGLPASIDYPQVLVTVGEEAVDKQAVGIDQVAISWKEPKPKPKPVDPDSN